MKIFIALFFLFSLLTFITCNGNSEDKSNDAERKVGGENEIDVNDPNVEALLKEHLPRIDGVEQGQLKLVKKTKITKQVVAGMAYHITTTFNNGQSDMDCEIIIWTRPWLNDTNEKVKIKVDCGEAGVYRVKGETTEW
jgi:hypothetical protein